MVKAETPEEYQARMVIAGKEWQSRLDQQPGLFEALSHDAMIFATHRGEGRGLGTRAARWRYALKTLWRSEAFLGLALYRIRTTLRNSGVPIVPQFLNFVCAGFFGIRIGDPVVLKAGVYIPHGQIVIDGIVLIGSGCTICPWTTIGLQKGRLIGPKLEPEVFVGTGAKVLGDIVIGDGARIGANAVVVTDVPAGATAVGVPAKVTPHRDTIDPPDA